MININEHNGKGKGTVFVRRISSYLFDDLSAYLLTESSDLDIRSCGARSSGSAGRRDAEILMN